MAWRSCVRDRSLTAHKLLTDRGLRRLPDGNRSCNLRGTVSPFGPRFTDHLNMRGARALTLRKKGEVSMLGMTRWTPWTELAGVHRDLDSLFNRVFGDTVRSQSVDAFTPAADLRRDGDTWKVSMALPGISPDKVDIDIVGRTLRI